MAAGVTLFPMAGWGGQDHAMSDPWQYAAELRQRIKVPTFPDRDFSIADFGARGDKKTDCTKAINEAIRACSEAGGGRVVVPAGNYRTGAIHPLRNVNLHLVEDATLSFYTEPEKYSSRVGTGTARGQDAICNCSRPSQTPYPYL